MQRGVSRLVNRMAETAGTWGPTLDPLSGRVWEAALEQEGKKPPHVSRPAIRMAEPVRNCGPSCGAVPR